MVETNLPVLVLKDIVLFPYNEIRVEFSKTCDKLVLANASKYNDSHILLINLYDPLEENPSIKDLPNVGIIGKIKSKIEKYGWYNCKNANFVFTNRWFFSSYFDYILNVNAP